MRVLVIFGTRPEAIKMCPLVLEMKKYKEIECKVCLTGQHKEMLNSVMDVFGIKPDYNLSIMRTNQTLSMITTEVLNGVEKILKEEKPDVVLVHGDTTTSYAAALAAYYNHIMIGHVEAGLRTYNMQSPYPEEFNRQSVDLISEFLFAPTEYAKKTLIQEGKKPQNIFITGNTVIDSFCTTVRSNYQNENIEWAQGSKLILMTAHRRENIGHPMEMMFRGIRRVVDDNKDVKLIYPLHKNPKVREIAQKYLSNHKRIRLIEPLDVCDFHNIMSRCFLILTDSGGIQEEAPSFGVPVLVMRTTTERPEGIETGTLKLIGTDEEDIYEQTSLLLRDRMEYQKMQTSENPYGDGHASERIVNILRGYFN